MRAVGLYALTAALMLSCGDEAGTEGNNTGGSGAPMTPSGSPTGSCNIAQFGFCIDYWGDVSGVSQACAGDWSTTPCDSTLSCGVCSVDAGGYQAVTYYFDGSGAESTSASTCANGMGTWTDVSAVTCN